MEDQVAVVNELMAKAKASQYGNKPSTNSFSSGMTFGSVVVQALSRKNSSEVQGIVLTGSIITVTDSTNVAAHADYYSAPPTSAQDPVIALNGEFASHCVQAIVAKVQHQRLTTLCSCIPTLGHSWRIILRTLAMLSIFIHRQQRAFRLSSMSRKSRDFDH